MTTLADRTIAALRAIHDDLAATVPGLCDEQLAAPSGATEWPVAQVLSHMGSGAEIALAGLDATVAGTPAPAPEFNQQVWDRWNAMSARDQAAGFLDHDARLLTAYEALTAEQREKMEVDLAFLPVPLPLASVVGMRLNEAAQHSWDVRVAFDPDAGISDDAARVLAEQLAGGLGFMTGFAGNAYALTAPAVVEIRDLGFGIVIDDGVSVATSVESPTATFVGPLESAIRLIGGRLGPEHTPAGVEVTGNVTLDDLRRVFPGY
jgi:uncharacterized protein (TIGR03083 family)